MGGYFKKVTKKILGRRETLKGEKTEIANLTKILIYGQPSSGKKTIREKLYEQSENAKYWKLVIGNTDLLFGVYGRGFTRPISRRIYTGVEAVVFVIDSSGTDRYMENYYLQQMMSEEKLKDCPFALVANKKDLCDGFSADEITKELGEEALKDKKWKLFQTTAKTGEGIEEVFDWLTEQIGEPEGPTSVEEDNKEVDKMTQSKKEQKVDSIFLSNLVSKFKKTFFLSAIKA